MMYNDQLVYKVVIWAFFGISLWKDKVALSKLESLYLKGKGKLPTPEEDNLKPNCLMLKLLLVMVTISLTLTVVIF